MSRNVLVTGGGRGIGAGIVEQLLSENYNVAFCDIGEESEYAERCRELAAKYPGKPLYIRCDISSTADRIAMLDRIAAEFGELDILINNAGVAPLKRADILEATEESFDRLININLKGPYFLTQLVANRMIAAPKPGRVIVNMGSCSAEVASVSRGEYCISKAGVGMATKLWAARLGEFDIPVFEIRPGVIKTPMTSVVTDKYNKLIAEGLTVTPRWGFPEDIAKAVSALVAGKFNYSTGQVINVDGGMSIQRL